MTQWTITTAIVLDQATGQVALTLAGQTVQVVVRGTTTPYPILAAGSLDPVPSSLLTVSPVGTLPPFVIDTDAPEDLYLDWRDTGSGLQGGIGFEEVMRSIAVQARDAAVAVEAGLSAAITDAVATATAAAAGAQAAAQAAAATSTAAVTTAAAAAQQAATNAQAAAAQVMAMLSGADGAVDQLVAGLIAAPASAVRAALAASGLGSGSGRVDYVYIGADGATWPARPTSDADIVVLWVGGTDQPEGMLATDLWLQSGGSVVADTTPPSVPTGLATSSLTSTGFRLYWTASTDDVGVTGYQVQMDSGAGYTLAGSPTATELLIGALSASQTVQVRVRARDAAGNWSAWSGSLEVTTAASGGLARHSVFSSSYPYTVVADTATYPTVANAFYTYTGAATGWKVVGARVWVPESALASLPPTIDVHVWHQSAVYGSGAAAPNLAAPTETVATDTLVAGWNEVAFSTPRVMTALAPIWVGYTAANGAYLVTSPPPGTSGFIAAGDGSPLVLAETLSNGIYRAYVRNGAGATVALTTAHIHAVDVIVEEA